MGTFVVLAIQWSLDCKSAFMNSLEDHIQEFIEQTARRVFESYLNNYEDFFTTRKPNPEFESWGRYLTIKQAMVYTGYSSKNGLYSFLNKFQIQLIKNSSKDVKIDRYEIDQAMNKKIIMEYKKQLAAW